MATNTLKITREFDGHVVTGFASYIESVAGWDCRVTEGHGGEPTETRGPINDPWAELQDMIELGIGIAVARDRANAGPFSNAQCA